MLGGCVRLMLDSYVIKQYKWDKEIRSSYVWQLRQNQAAKVTLDLHQKFP